MKKLFHLFLILFIFAFIIACGSKEPKKAETRSETVISNKVFKVGRITYMNPRELLKEYSKLLEYLKPIVKKYGYTDVELVLTKDYETLAKKFMSGKVDLAWVGTSLLNFFRKRNFPVKVVVRPIWNGRTSYKGMIITRKNSPINSLDDLRGKSFAFTDLKSASGFMFPFALLIENGINPKKDFRKILFLEQHDRVLKAVYVRKVDAGAVFKGAPEKLKKVDPKAFKVLAYTKEIPTEPLLVRKDFNEKLYQDLKQAFMKLRRTDSQYAEILKPIKGLDGFVSASIDDYAYSIKVSKLVEKYWGKN